MSIVTSLRNIGLVKLASLSHAIEHVRLGFNFQPQVLAHTNPEVFRVIDAVMYKEGMNGLVESVDADLYKTIVACFESIGTVVEGEDATLKIIYADEHRSHSVAVGAPGIASGSLADSIRIGVPLPHKMAIPSITFWDKAVVHSHKSKDKVQKITQQCKSNSSCNISSN